MSRMPEHLTEVERYFADREPNPLQARAWLLARRERRRVWQEFRHLLEGNLDG